MSKFYSFIVAIALVASITSVASAQTDIQAQITALLAQIAQLQAQLGTTQAATATAYNFTKDLTIGSKGDDVTALQGFLESKGFLTMPAGVAKGYFGNLTKTALSAYQSSVSISPAAGYFGPKTRAMVNSTLAAAPATTPTTTPAVTTPIVSGFSVALASDNPAGTTVPKGVTGAAFLKITISGTGTVDTLTFKRTGIGAAGDFLSSGVYLYEGAKRLTSGKTINSTTHEISFVNLGLKVEGTKTLTLAASVSSAATAGNVHAFALTEVVTTPTIAGTFPLTGNSMTIGGQAVGGTEIAEGALPTNPKVGQVSAKLAEFTLTASSTEDVKISRISLTEGGTITNSYLSNFVLKQSGNSIATAATIGDKDLLTFELTSPFSLEKGQQRTFEVYGDISGSVRSGDTISFYVDNIADIAGTGMLYGYPIAPNINTNFNASDAHTLTVQGGQVTITFNGPLAGDLALRAQDVVVFDFTLASQNNIEIKQIVLNASTTGLGANQGFNDMKIWDADKNVVLTSAQDVTTSSVKTFTDVINVNAGQSKRFKVTVDVDADNDDSDDITIALAAFGSSDIKNLDNNTYVATSVIVPNTLITGNVQDTRKPTLDIQLAASPVSQAIVRGTTDVALTGFTFRATGGDVRLDMLKVTASSTSGSLTNAKVTSLKLYDGTTQIGETKSLDVTALTAQFTDLNKTITKGETKTLTVKGTVDRNASSTDIFAIKIANRNTDITVYDKDGNTATTTGTNANDGATVKITIVDTGDVTVAKASDDTDSEAGIVVAGTEAVLGKFTFTSTNEEMTVNKLQIMINASSTATATSSTAVNEVPTIKLYDGLAQVGATAGYSVTFSGDYSGVAFVDTLGWKVPKNDSKTLTVKGVAANIADGADTGADVYAHILAQTADGTYKFEAQGATGKDTSITAASGNRKIVYKTKPTLSAGTQPTNKLANGTKEVLKFKVAADSKGDVAWKFVQFQVAMTGATMSAASTANVTLQDVSTGASLTLSIVYSGAGTASSTTATITGGNTGYIAAELSTEERVSAGTSKEYLLSLTFADTSATAGAASVDVKLYRQETTSANATWYAGIAGAAIASDMNPSFIWSDRSVTGHATSTADWANGLYVKPGLFTDVKNTISN